MMMVSGTLGFRCHVVFHANHAVGMVVMGNDRYHQHNNADEEQKREYVPFIPHSYFYIEPQR
ncbi:hypothetical protein AOQ65_06000 [Bacteroides fragilis]|nr:hypothetical protein AOQ65_06000 [Bacteroides fragilis]